MRFGAVLHVVQKRGYCIKFPALFVGQRLEIGVPNLDDLDIGYHIHL